MGQSGVRDCQQTGKISAKWKKLLLFHHDGTSTRALCFRAAPVGVCTAGLRSVPEHSWWVARLALPHGWPTAGLSANQHWPANLWDRASQAQGTNTNSKLSVPSFYMHILTNVVSSLLQWFFIISNETLVYCLLNVCLLLTKIWTTLLQQFNSYKNSRNDSFQKCRNVWVGRSSILFKWSYLFKNVQRTFKNDIPIMFACFLKV